MPFQCAVVSGKAALELCLKIREENKGLITPVVLGLREDMERLVEMATYNEDSVEEILEKAEKLTASDFFKKRTESDPEMIEFTEAGEVPAYIKFGNWNECPSPEEQVATLKYWFDEYEARVISITADIIECTVDNPPSSEDGSMKLAIERFLYCSDNVLQGLGRLLNMPAVYISLATGSFGGIDHF